MKKTLAIILTACLTAIVGFSFSACGEKPYDISYATWNLSTEAVNNVERQMIKEFEKRNNVRVRIEENIAQGTGYPDSITALALKNKLPDVFMLDNIQYGLSTKYSSDVSDLINADTTKAWDSIPKPIEEAVHYNNGIYAIPFGMYMMGYFANVDLLKEKNLNGYLNGEFTFDKLYQIASKATNKKDGIMGLSHENTIIEWYPASKNANLDWFTWDGSKYNLDSEEFKEGIEKTKMLRDGGYTFDSLSADERKDLFEGVEGYVDLWNKGKLALRWGASYEAPNMLENTDFETRFLGVPGGRTPIVGDYLAISSTCKNRELAYKFAKWMSFDPDGIRQRISIEKQITNTMPLTTDEAVIAEYFDKFDAIDGMKDVFKTLDNGIVECTKVVPGYTLSRWKALTGISVKNELGEDIANCELGKYLDLCWMGFADYKPKEANDLANKWYKKAIDEISD